MNAQAHVLLGHRSSKLLRVLGLLQQGLALRVEAIHLFQGAVTRLQDEVAELGDLQLHLRRQGNRFSSSALPDYPLFQEGQVTSSETPLLSGLFLICYLGFISADIAVLLFSFSF